MNGGRLRAGSAAISAHERPRPRELTCSLGKLTSENLHSVVAGAGVRVGAMSFRLALQASAELPIYQSETDCSRSRRLLFGSNEMSNRKADDAGRQTNGCHRAPRGGAAERAIRPPSHPQ